MVALDIQLGVCYGLNRIATRIWQIIQSPSSPEQIADVLTREFEVDQATCIAETMALLNDMFEARLVVASSEPAAA